MVVLVAEAAREESAEESEEGEEGASLRVTRRDSRASGLNRPDGRSLLRLVESCEMIPESCVLRGARSEGSSSVAEFSIRVEEDSLCDFLPLLVFLRSGVELEKSR